MKSRRKEQQKKRMKEQKKRKNHKNKIKGQKRRKEQRKEQKRIRHNKKVRNDQKRKNDKKDRNEQERKKQITKKIVLPKVIEDLIMYYRGQMEMTARYDECVKEVDLCSTVIDDEWLEDTEPCQYIKEMVILRKTLKKGSGTTYTEDMYDDDENMSCTVDMLLELQYESRIEHTWNERTDEDWGYLRGKSYWEYMNGLSLGQHAIDYVEPVPVRTIQENFKECLRELHICNNVMEMTQHLTRYPRPKYENVLDLIILIKKKTKPFTNHYECGTKFYWLIKQLGCLWNNHIVEEIDAREYHSTDPMDSEWTMWRGPHFFDYMDRVPDLRKRFIHGIPIVEQHKTECLKELITCSRSILRNGETDISITFQLIDMIKCYSSNRYRRFPERFNELYRTLLYFKIARWPELLKYNQNTWIVDILYQSEYDALSTNMRAFTELEQTLSLSLDEPHGERSSSPNPISGIDGPQSIYYNGGE